MNTLSNISIRRNTKQCCVACKAPDVPFIYCEYFNTIIKSDIKFDETGELDGCEFFKERENPIKKTNFKVEVSSALGKYVFLSVTHDGNHWTSLNIEDPKREIPEIIKVLNEYMATVAE